MIFLTFSNQVLGQGSHFVTSFVIAKKSSAQATHQIFWNFAGEIVPANVQMLQCSHTTNIERELACAEERERDQTK